MKTEIIEKRTINSKTFRNSDGSFTLQTHAGHIHYLDRNTGKLEDIKNDVIENGNGWEMRKAGYEVELPKTSKGAVRFFVNKFDKDIYSVRQKEIPKFVKQRKFNGQDNIDFTLTKIAGQPIKEVQGVKTDHHQITYPDVADGIDLVLSCGFNSFRKEVVIKEMPEFEGDFLEIEFATNRRFLTKVRGRRFQKDNLHFRNPIVSDARGEIEDIEIEFGWNKLVKRIPREFLEKAVYPVRTDTTESYYTGSGDGYVHNADASWSACRSATDGDSADYTVTFADARARYYTGGSVYQIRRVFWPVDTSGLPDNASISDATWYFYVDKDNSTIPDASVYCVSASQASASSLGTADFDQVGSTSFGSVNIPDGSGLVQHSISLNSSGISNISKTGWSKFALRENKDFNNIAPNTDGTDSNWVNTKTSEYTDTTYDPYLEVDYTIAQSYSVTCTEVLNTTDTLSKNWEAKKTITETFSTADTTAKQAAFAKTLTDTFSLSDAVSSLRANFVTILETINITDTLSKTTNFVKTISEALSLSDALTASKKFFVSITETINLSDTVTKVSIFVKTITETLTLVSSVTIGKFWNKLTKHTSSWTQGTKHTSSWTQGTKHTSSWTQGTKHTSSWTELTKH